jgi:hypothetical protein
MPPYVGGRQGGSQAAKANTEAARPGNEAVRDELGFEVSRAFAALRARRFIKLLRRRELFEVASTSAGSGSTAARCSNRHADIQGFGWLRHAGPHPAQRRRPGGARTAQPLGIRSGLQVADRGPTVTAQILATSPNVLLAAALQRSGGTGTGA